MQKLYLGTKDRDILGPIGKINEDIFENMSNIKFDFPDMQKLEEKLYLEVLHKAIKHSDLADSLSYSVPQHDRITADVICETIEKLEDKTLSFGVPKYKIVVTTKKVQNRTHHKKRINKKWAKRYGYTYYETQKDDTMYVTSDSTIYCTQKGFETIIKSIGGTKQCQQLKKL